MRDLMHTCVLHSPPVVTCRLASFLPDKAGTGTTGIDSIARSGNGRRSRAAPHETWEFHIVDGLRAIMQAVWRPHGHGVLQE